MPGQHLLSIPAELRTQRASVYDIGPSEMIAREYSAVRETAEHWLRTYLWCNIFRGEPSTSTSDDEVHLGDYILHDSSLNSKNIVGDDLDIPNFPLRLLVELGYCVFQCRHALVR